MAVETQAASITEAVRGREAQCLERLFEHDFHNRSAEQFPAFFIEAQNRKKGFAMAQKLQRQLDREHFAIFLLDFPALLFRKRPHLRTPAW